MFLLYNLLLTLFSPIWVPWALWRAWRRKEKPDWGERTGNYKAVPPKGERPRLWVHAVSVGEVVAARPILKAVRKAMPYHEIVLSVTTSSGHRTAREGDTSLFDFLVYFPFDVLRFQMAAMQKVRPDAVLIMETEIWMNFLWAAKVFDARTLLVNGRISDRAFPRSSRLAFFYKVALENLDRALMQTALDVERIRVLGAKSAEVYGNCKFDQAIETSTANPIEWKKSLGIPSGNHVLVVGSTRGEFEEQIVIDAISQIGDDRLSVIHAPRHLEDAPALEARVKSRFGSVAIRSMGETGSYLVLDSYGELASTYSVADVVVVGGGFADLGGQNIVQPLALGKPVVHGPHMQNFREPTRMADESGAAICCRDANELGATLKLLFADKGKRVLMGEAAKALVVANVGASQRYAEAVVDEIRSHPIKPRRKRR